MDKLQIFQNSEFGQIRVLFKDNLYNLIENINSKTEYTKNDIQQLINTFETVLITAKQTYFEHGATSGISNINKIYLTPSEAVLHG